MPLGEEGPFEREEEKGAPPRKCFDFFASTWCALVHCEFF